MIKIYELDVLLGTITMESGKLRIKQEAKSSTGANIRSLLDSLFSPDQPFSSAKEFYEALPGRLQGRIFAVRED